ncbi:hypothetical protein ASG25_10710 [Rhizobium sp. Leaf384]|nr:hypothetical protein ASG25_10710 [Rhizobium sp. Leaf384]
MFVIRHTIEDRQGELLHAEDLDRVFDDENGIMTFLEDLTNEFDHNGYDGENDRWWAWNDVAAAQLHLWWKVALAT